MAMNDFDQALKKAGAFRVAGPGHSESVILQAIQNGQDEKQDFFAVPWFKPALAFLAGVLVLLSVWAYLTPPAAQDSQVLFDQIVSVIRDANAARDVDKAMGIYSDDFFRSSSRSDIRRNIEDLFRNYRNIEYCPEKEKVIVSGNTALIANRVSFYAEAEKAGLPEISYQGREKIYLKRHHNKWQITAWLFEEEKI